MSRVAAYRTESAARIRAGKIAKEALIYLLIIIILVILVVPVYWIVVTALKPGSETFNYSVVFKPTLSNFSAVLQQGDFRRYYGNSLILATSATTLSIVIGFPAAYALSRFKMRGKENVSFWILSLRMIPPIVVALPFFIMYRTLHLYDSLFGLVLVYIAFTLPFVIWMVRGYIDEVPLEIEEAARVDGCSDIALILRITLPLCITGIVAIGVLSFIFIWNEFLLALTLTGVERRTVTVGVYNFVGFTEILWGQMSAASVLISVPIIAFGVLVRKYLVSGLTLGALKE